MLRLTESYNFSSLYRSYVDRRPLVAPASSPRDSAGPVPLPASILSPPISGENSVASQYGPDLSMSFSGPSTPVALNTERFAKQMGISPTGRLTRSFTDFMDDSVDDSFDQIPAESTRTGEEPEIVVVGVERDGILLVRVITLQPCRTVLFLYDKKKDYWEDLLIWDQVVDVVSATIPVENPVIVAYTVRYVDRMGFRDPLVRYSHTQSLNTLPGRKDSVEMYQTSVESVHDRKVVHFTERTAYAQRVHFVTSYKAKKEWIFYFLHVTPSEKTLMISASCKYTIDKFGKQSPMTIRLKEEKVIAESMRWLEFDPRTNTFIYIAPRGQNMALKKIIFVREYISGRMMRVTETIIPYCIHFHSTPNMIKYGNTPLPFVVRGADDPPAVNSPVPFDLSYSTPAISPIRSASPQKVVEVAPPTLTYTQSLGTDCPLPNVRLIEVENEQVYLCIQKGFQRNSDRSLDTRTISIAIVALPINLYFDFKIPNPSGSRDARVVFDLFCDYLIIYLPGSYFQMIDVSNIHNPTVGFVLPERETVGMASPILSKVSPLSPVKMNTRIPLSAANAVDTNALLVPCSLFGKGQFLLDMRTGQLFEYDFDRKYMVELMTAPNTSQGLQVALIHLACMHMKDTELVTQLMTNVLLNIQGTCTVNLLKEYLLGMTYLNMSTSPRASTYSAFLEGLPCTQTDEYRLPPPRYFSEYAKGLVENFKRIPKVQEPFVDLIIKDKFPKDFLHEYWRPLSSIERRFFRRRVVMTLQDFHNTIFGADIRASRNLANYGRNETADFLAQSPSHFISVQGEKSSVLKQYYIDRITEVTKGVTLDVTSHFVNKFLARQNDETRDLFILIETVVGTLDKTVEVKDFLFGVYENLICCIQELESIAAPDGLNQKMVMTAYDILPPRTFLEYFQRGVLKFNRTIALILGNSPCPPHFLRAFGRDPTEQMTLPLANPELWYSLLNILSYEEGFDHITHSVRNIGREMPMFLMDGFLNKNYKLFPVEKKELDATYNESDFIPLSLVVSSLKGSSQAATIRRREVDDSVTYMLDQASEFDVLMKYLTFPDGDETV